jgi:MinD-like ATPase involved in chromosome partitioning or flagellar assembly
MENNIIEEELKNLKRRMDSIQKTLDLLYNDRTLLEDVVNRLAQVENAVHLNREHQVEVQQQTKSDIEQIGSDTADKVEEIKKTIGEKTIIVKSEKENIMEKIIKKLKGGKENGSSTTGNN